MAKRIWCVLVALVLACGLGCKGGWTIDKFCAEMREAYAGDEVSDEDCKRMFDGANEQCSNVDEVFTCVAGAADKAAFRACKKTCKEK